MAQLHAETSPGLLEGPCCFGWNINMEELRSYTVIPAYLRNAMAEAVGAKRFVYEEGRHKGNGEKPPEAPIVVFINSKSGGRQGPQLKTRLQDLLSQEQVFDLSIVRPEDFFRHGLGCLEKIASFGDLCAQETRNRIRIMVAGGDGTVGWVLGSISELHLENRKPIPPVGIIPLGTGNDLARSFGWGGTFPFALKSAVKKFLLKAVKGQIRSLDSWQVMVKTVDGQEVNFPYALKIQEKTSLSQDENLSGNSIDNASCSKGVFYNYFSIGMDAQVAYGFHHLRNKRPYLARGPILNKMIYSGYSCTQGWFCTPCSTNPRLRGINNILNLHIKRRKTSEWEQITIPSSVRAIVALNLHNYASGRNPWGHPKPSYLEKKGLVKAQVHDGLIEIFGLKDGWHTSFVMVDLITAKHIAQDVLNNLTPANKVVTEEDTEMGIHENPLGVGGMKRGHTSESSESDSDFVSGKMIASAIPNDLVLVISTDQGKWTLFRIMEGASSKNTNNLKVSKKSQKSLFKYFGNSADTDIVNTNHIDATTKNQNTDCVEGIIEVDMHSAQYQSQTNETYDNMPDLEDIVPVGVQPEVQLDITDTNTQQNGRQKSKSNSGLRKRKPGDCDIAQNSTQKSKALKTNKNMWTIGRTYKFDWAAKFLFIEPVQSSNSEEIPSECTCTICTWKLGKQQKMQLKLDTIEKHCGKQYLTVTGADGQKIKTHRWKTEKECMHVKYTAEYEAEQKKHRHLLEKRGTITSHIDGKKLLKDVETRWISLYEPACRVREEYPSLVGFMHKYRHEVDRARDLFHLTDLETLLTLVGILPMLKEINTLMKHAQGRLIYIVDFIRMRKMVCQSLDILYCSQDSFDALVFENWKDLLDLKNPNTFLRFNIHDHLCITVNGREIPMHILQKCQDITGSEREDVPVTRNLFDSGIVETRIKLKQISETLSSEIRERFCKDKILEAMGVMNPNF
ncbi:hypothetical protein KI387_030231 [Taxus chinensis]|uniref:Diacylglycerol kinase n=1 Tax=Taxus chinensis TaxID=29808 RepID=A0AA38CKK4_TAXCH|nr:hypothetical protein KI387_030231 [Taxus chinensis]